ncbi:hypothetical protein DM860_004073 [Cuscuta australis]|uniref:histone acetyltransferase n=1 Tax=Cuscuta australis TaxID=267555 RepID=A0A328CXX3_9ASTE|nr:hypothetical protein DM860_004073 [Cuscuta australis]
MGTKHHSSSSSDPKKRRRVGFSKIDAGVEAGDCISIYLVSKQEEVGSTSSFQLETVDLNTFFDDDGRIFGYQSLKITIWVNTISFHAYADISFESSYDGGRGITDLKPALQNIFGENLVEEKDVFLQTFKAERHYIKSLVSNAESLQYETSNEDQAVSHAKAFRIVGEPLGIFYCRLVPLVLLLVEGSNPIDVNDPRWEIYLSVKSSNPEEDDHIQLLGFAAVYRFHHYPDGARLRLGQILVLPQYQHKGYGCNLIKVLNSVATCENVYDLTVEEPDDSFQHVRTCIDIERLLAFDPVKCALDSDVSRLKHEGNASKRSVGDVFRLRPPAKVVEDVRKALKINKRQLMQCWEILIYLHLDPTVAKHMDVYRAVIADRVKGDFIGRDSQVSGKRIVDVPTEYDEDTSFVMFKSHVGGIEKDEKQDNLEEQLEKLLDERMKQIKSTAEKVSAILHI